MKKIIAAFDGIRFSDSTLQYAVYLAKQCDAHLVGIFLRESTVAGYALYELVARQSISGSKIFEDIESSDKENIHQSISKFVSACRDADINYSLHQDKKNAVDELIHETLFADLLVIDAWETFSYLVTKLPGWFMKQVLHESHCPVIVVPQKFMPLKKVSLLYDGSPASIFAMKIFNYVLPEFSTLKTQVISAVKKNSSPLLPENKLVKEWMTRRNSAVQFKVIRGGTKELMTSMEKENGSCLIVAGSYQRSQLSMWFHESIANLLMRKTKTPVFIAHL
jgi:hypothetical protein